MLIQVTEPISYLRRRLNQYSLQWTKNLPIHKNRLVYRPQEAALRVWLTHLETKSDHIAFGKVIKTFLALPWHVAWVIKLDKILELSQHLLLLKLMSLKLLTNSIYLLVMGYGMWCLTRKLLPSRSAIEAYVLERIPTRLVKQPRLKIAILHICSAKKLGNDG